MITLIAKGGDLYTSFGAIVDKEQRDYYASLDNTNPLLIYHYPFSGGDYDTINWPNYNPEHLRGALYDSREMGLIPSICESVVLPDGKIFVIDEPTST